MCEWTRTNNTILITEQKVCGLNEPVCVRQTAGTYDVNGDFSVNENHDPLVDVGDGAWAYYKRDNSGPRIRWDFGESRWEIATQGPGLLFYISSTDLFDERISWSTHDNYNSDLKITKGSCDGGLPEEVHICGETNFIADGYYGKHADGKYVRNYDPSHNQHYYQTGENEFTTKYLWYDADRYNWVVSKELFNADTAVMYRHKIELEGSEWFVIGNGDSETCNPDSVRSITCDWLYTGQKIFVSEEDCSNLPIQGRFETIHVRNL